MFKKAISIGVTAALLGSLMVAILPAGAAAAPATVTITKTADIPRGTCGVDSYLGTASIVITEETAGEWPSGGFAIRFAIRDADNNPGNGTVHFAETGIAVGPDSLSPSFYFGDLVPDRIFWVTAGSTNTSQVETLTISGLTICADWNAALGDVLFRYQIYGGGTWNMGGNHPLYATGRVAAAAGPAATTIMAVTDPGWSPFFHATTSAPGYGPLELPAFPPYPKTTTITNVATFDTNGNNITINPALGFGVIPGDKLEQYLDLGDCHGGPWDWNWACRLATPGTVIDSLWSKTNGPLMIQRGLVNSQPAGFIQLGEWNLPDSDTYIPAGKTATVTLALDPAIGVKFSGSVQSVWGAPCEPDAARTTLTCKIYGTDNVDTWMLGNPTGGGPPVIPLDASVASAAAQEVWVTITVTGSTYPVVPSKQLIAILNNTADATADAPTVIIGENDQQAGTVTIREAAAGVLGSGAGNNVLEACYASHEEFTRAPYLVVTAGDLKLRNPADPNVPAVAAAPGTGVKGMIVPWAMSGFNCAVWIVWSKSTVASTLEIRGQAADGSMLAAGAAHGPQINVPHWLRPGPSQLWLGSGSWFSTGTEFRTVVNAIRAFGATPVVAAVSSPEIMKGEASQAAGNVTITETASAQFGAGEQILFSIVMDNLRDIIPSKRFDTNRDTPVVSTNAASTGLVAHFQGYLNPIQFAVAVDQRAFVPVVGAWVPGVITVGSLKYTTTNDAAYGKVMLEVCTPSIALSTGLIDMWHELFAGQFGVGMCFYKGLYGHDGLPHFGEALTSQQENQKIMTHPGAWADFSQVVSNAHVVSEGLFPSLAIAPGYKFRETGPYVTYGTVVVKSGTYITNKVYVGPQFQGTRIEFWQRNSKTGTWVKRTTGRVDGKGYAYWSTIPPKLGGTGFDRYVYYRAYFAGTNTVAAAWSQTTGRVVVK